MLVIAALGTLRAQIQENLPELAQFIGIAPRAATPPESPAMEPPKPPKTVASVSRDGALLSGELLVCDEKTRCPGQAVGCVLAGDDSDGGAGTLGLLNRDPNKVGFIDFGNWTNTECGQSGYGWFVSFVSWGSCGTGKGSGLKRCKYVILEAPGAGE